MTTFVFRDEVGNLVEMPNFSFADFEKAYKLLQGLTQQDPRPRFSVQWLSLTGTVEAGHASMELTARVLVRDRNWVRVPLRLEQAMVREPLEASTTTEAYLHPESEGEGYVCYLRGEPDQQHTIKLKLLVPLTTSGGRTRLVLRLPRATASELKLKVPMAEVEAEVSEGATLLPPSPIDNGTELTVLGVGGDFRLTWGPPQDDSVAVPVVLQADGAIGARMDGPTVTWNAVVSVRSFGAPFDRFQVRLPVGSQLVPDQPSGYTVAPAPSSEGEAALGPVVEVRLDKKTAGPVEVRLAARRVIEESHADDWSDLAGFAVVDAVRQSGHLAVAVPNDWQVLWGPQRGVSRLDQLPEPLRKDDVLAGFEYSMQPALLQARLVPKTTRLNVRPEYLVLVGTERVDLRAKLRYSIRGAKVYALALDLAGWQLDSLEPETLVALDGVKLDESGQLNIPLIQPTRGDLELTILAHRSPAASIGEGQPTAMELPLPRPRADTSSAALVVLAPDDNLELTPVPEKSVGLVRQRKLPTVDLPTRQQPVLCFRGESPDAVFAGTAQRLPRRIEANASSRIVLNSSTAHVEQHFEYTILHEPAEHFLLEVPKSLIADDRLQFEVFHEGAAAPIRAGGNGAPAASGTTVVMQVDLQEPCIGRCELVVTYPLPLPEATEHGGTDLSAPLIAPYKVSLESNRVLLTTGTDRSAEVVDNAWRPLDLDDPMQPTGEAERTYAARGPRERIELRIGRPNARSLDATVVERAWVQTWLIRTEHSDRQDRAVFRLRTTASQVDVELPPGAAMEQVFVWIDSERVETFAMDGNRLYIPLPGDGTLTVRSLELGYHFPSLASRQGSMAIELPQVGDQTWVQRMYWQLVLPRHEHVVVGPEGFTSESPWGWKGYLFARNPLLEQPELEEWSGGARRTPISQDTNRYLFSVSGYPRLAALRTAKRSWIVLGASGLALVAGLVLIYIPAGRHPATLFAAAVVLACVGSLYPAPTLLVAQAASLGLGLTLLAGLLERSVTRRRSIPSASGVYGSPEGDSTLTQHEAARLGDPTTTQAVALGIGPDLARDSFP